MTEKFSGRHIARVFVGDTTGQIIEFQFAQLRRRSLGIHLFQQLLARERQLFIGEATALGDDRCLRDGRQGKRERCRQSDK